MPVVDMEDVDRFIEEFEIFENGSTIVDKAGGVIFAAVDFAAMKIAGRVARFEQVDVASFAFSSPHRIVELEAFEVGNLHFDLMELADINKVIFWKDAMDIMALFYQLAAEANDGIAEAARFREGGKFSSNMNNTHDFDISNI